MEIQNTLLVCKILMKGKVKKKTHILLSCKRIDAVIPTPFSVGEGYLYVSSTYHQFSYAWILGLQQLTFLAEEELFLKFD